MNIRNIALAAAIAAAAGAFAGDGAKTPGKFAGGVVVTIDGDGEHKVEILDENEVDKVLQPFNAAERRGSRACRGGMKRAKGGNPTSVQRRHPGGFRLGFPPARFGGFGPGFGPSFGPRFDFDFDTDFDFEPGDGEMKTEKFICPETGAEVTRTTWSSKKMFVNGKEVKPGEDGKFPPLPGIEESKPKGERCGCGKCSNSGEGPKPKMRKGRKFGEGKGRKPAMGEAGEKGQNPKPKMRQGRKGVEGKGRKPGMRKGRKGRKDEGPKPEAPKAEEPEAK